MSKVICLWAISSVIAGMPDVSFDRVVVDDKVKTDVCAVADVDGDGAMDIVSGVVWYRGPKWERVTGDGKPVAAAYAGGRSGATSDVNGDGWLDVVSIGSDSRIRCLLNPGEGGQEGGAAKGAVDGIDAAVAPHVVMADVDGDGDADLVGADRSTENGGQGGLAWYELKRDGGRSSFTKHVIDDGNASVSMIAAGDADGDGDIDIITAGARGVTLYVQRGEPTFLPLFNGRDLDNWVGDHSFWSVEDGTLVGRTEGIKKNHFLVSKEKYGDFVLTLQVKLVPDSANSGIQFRSTPHENGEVEGYQADIGVDWWGSIYEELGRGKLHEGYKGLGKRAVIKNGWNDYVVFAVGDELRVEINGTVCTAMRDAARQSGVIALQIHSGGPTDVRFRNVKLRRVPGDRGGS